MGGYHTEYSGMKLALFFLGEYMHMITTSLLVVMLFFGGWQLPWLVTPGPDNGGTIILKLIVLSVKMILFILFYMFVRWTMPRFRFDQLMGLAWKVLMPLALVNVVAVLVVRQFSPQGGLSDLLITAVSIAALIGFGAYTRHAAATADPHQDALSRSRRRAAGRGRRPRGVAVIGSLPPCGGGLELGVNPPNRHPPPPAPPPQGGEGRE